MNRQDRAKQFAPFDALKGLKEALREKELLHFSQSKKEVCEDLACEIQNTLVRINKGDTVKLKHYKDGFYVEFNGVVEKRCDVYRYFIVSSEKIFYDDLYEIKLIK